MASKNAGLPSIAVVAIGSLLFLLLGYVYRRYSLTLPINSDHANALLEGHAVLHGNVILRHWALSTCSWYLTDIVLFAAGIVIRGVDPVLLHEVPVFEFLVTITLSIFLAARRLRGKTALLAGVAAFILIGLPVERTASEILLGGNHAATAMYLFLAFAAICGHASDGERLPLWRVGVMSAALTAANFSDTMTLYVAILPIILISGLRMKAAGRIAADEATIVAGAILAAALTKVMMSLIHRAGGFYFVSDATSISFIAFDKLPTNIEWTIEGLLVYFGADFFGQPLNVETAIEVVDLIPLALTFYALVVTLGRILRGTPEVDRLSAILATGMLITLVAYTISTLPNGILTIRYFVLFNFMGAILAGRLFAQDAPRRRGLILVFAIAGMLGLLHVARQALRPPADQPARHLAVFLMEQHLQSGFGGYWSSADTTAYAHEQVLVRPIEWLPPYKKLAPFMWVTSRAWYSAPANFVVTSDNPFGGVTEEHVVQTFGGFSQKYSVAGYNVYVFSHDIAPQLGPTPPQL